MVHINIYNSWEMAMFELHTFDMNDKPAISKVLSDNIKRLRKERHLSQEQLAERIGISVRHVSDIERTESFPSAEVIEMISSVFDVPSFTLFLPEEKRRIEIQYSLRIKTLLESEVSVALRKVSDKLLDDNHQ